MRQPMSGGRWLVTLTALALVSSVRAENSISVGGGTAPVGQAASVDVTVSSDSEVEGFVAAMAWSSAIATGSALTARDGAGEALEGADVIVTRVEADYAVLGVVLDTDGMGVAALPTGDNVVAALEVVMGGAEGTTPIDLVDGAFASVDGAPLLDNLVVIDGQSIGANDGLVLESGSLTATLSNDALAIESGGAGPADPCGNVRILLTNDSRVEGFTTAIAHGAGIVLEDITLGAAAVGADFAQAEIDAAVGGTFGVIVDLVDPEPDGPVIEPGVDQHVATYSYCCDAPVDAPIALEFVDGTLGSPPKDNLIIVGGLSIGQSDGIFLTNGTFTCEHPPADEVCDNGVDDDGDGLIDTDDPDCPEEPEPGPMAFVIGSRDGEPLEASRGDSVEVCFGVVINEDGAVGHAQPDHIQGFSMAVTFCSQLTCTSEDLDIEGTILEALGAEFVSMQCDNDDADGDGRELIIGVLIDALPPFDGQTIAPSFFDEAQPIGYATFDVSPDAACGDACCIEFTDGINGLGRVPIKNLVSHENHSSSPTLIDGCVAMVEQERFFRGDCNFSLGGWMAVDISDAAVVIAFLFQEGAWHFEPGCLDACDCQDDGRVDLADAICILQYLFLFGDQPPAPGPGWDIESQSETGAGSDPTPDGLDCELGEACDLRPQ